MSPNEFRVKKIGLKKTIWSKKYWMRKKLESKKFLGPTDLSGLGHSVRFKLGHMLHGQMFTAQMFQRKLTTHTDGLIIEFS